MIRQQTVSLHLNTRLTMAEYRCASELSIIYQWCYNIDIIDIA